MKVMTIFGTRPEIIRLSQIIKQLDKFCDHTLVHTGQNYDPNLSDIFFIDLGLRAPDIHLGIQATGFADQAGQIIARCGALLAQVQPDRVLILGDTNERARGDSRRRGWGFRSIIWKRAIVVTTTVCRKKSIGASLTIVVTC